MMQHLDLFSGIGGFALGLQRTGGFKTVAFCDFDPKTHLVLKKNFPGVPIFNDVKTLKGEDVGTIDIVTGGFPCQDLSVAGKGKGLAGERSGLWFEMLRIIKETQPKWVIAENVAVLRSRGLDQVLRSLDEIGYDAEWHCIPASAVGAPHRRDRIWIVAHPRHGSGRNSIAGSVGEDGIRGHDTGIRASETVASTGSSQASSTVAYSNGSVATNGGQCKDSSGKSDSRGTEQGRGASDDWQGCVRSTGSSKENAVAYSNNSGNRASKHGNNTEWSSIEQGRQEQSFDRFSGCSETMAYSSGQGLERFGTREIGTESEKSLSSSSSRLVRSIYKSDFWEVEPAVGRVADGVSNRVDRLKQLGNALVPQIVTMIGNAILEADKK